MKTQSGANSMGFARLLLAGFLFVSVASAVAERPQELSKPTDYVNDVAHVLSPNAVTRLDRICGQLDHSQANTQVAILTVHSLDGDDAADWANKVEDLWRIGKKGSDRGVLVLLAVDDHKWRIDVGYGLEGILPDGELGDIGRSMVPYLRANDYDDAVLAAVGKIAQVIAFDSKITIYDTQVDPPVAPRLPPSRSFSTGQIIFVSLVLLFFFVPVSLRIGYEIGKIIGLWKGPFPWRGYGNAEPSFRGDDASSGSGGGGGSDSASAGSSDPSGGGDFGGGGAGGSW